MKYRQLINNDYTLGLFLKDSPEAVGQAVLTRLRLWLGEWYVDLNEGTPYLQEILGHMAEHKGMYDLELQSRILSTIGVKEILEYNSTLNTTTRAFSVNCTLLTDYGSIALSI